MAASTPLNSADPLASARLEHLEARLHPVARELIRAHGLDARWARDALVALPTASCGAALKVAASSELVCTMVALGDGQVAVLVLGRPDACSEHTGFERSWVFVNRGIPPLELPPRRIVDYRSLRELLREDQASALWVAGFRAFDGDPRFAASAEAGPPPPRLVTYESCTLGPEGMELYCRSTRGDVIGLDPRSGATRLVAKLGLDLGELPAHALPPVTTGADGRLLVTVADVHHSLCAGVACDLVGEFVPRARSIAPVRLVPRDQAPW